MTESTLIRHIMLTVPAYGCRLFRNNTGILKDVRGKHVKFGLCVGSSDLIGWTKSGRFLAIEVKVKQRKPTAAQTRFMDAVNLAGGYATWVNSLEAFKREMEWVK